MSMRDIIKLFEDDSKIPPQSDADTDPDAAAAKDTGMPVEPAGDVPANFKDTVRLATVKGLSNLEAKGELFLYGRKPNGTIFRIEGVDQVLAHMSRQLASAAADDGDDSVEEQYDLLREKVNLIATNNSRSKGLLITGAPSAGKSTIVTDELAKCGLTKNKGYVFFKGVVAVGKIYRAFVQHVNGMIVFDDCDSVRDDRDGRNMIKNVLELNDERPVGYDKRGYLDVAPLPDEELDAYVEAVSRALNYKETDRDIDIMRKTLTKIGHMKNALNGETPVGPNASHEAQADEEEMILAYVRDNLPNKINFKGRIIFISNLKKEDWERAIRSRCLYQNLDFSSEQMLKYIHKVGDGIPTPWLTKEQKEEVMDYVRDLWVAGKLPEDVNFRFMIKAFDFRKKPHWKQHILQ